MIIIATEEQIDKLVEDIFKVIEGDSCDDDCHGGKCPYIMKEQNDTYCGQPSDRKQVYDLIKKVGKE